MMMNETAFHRRLYRPAGALLLLLNLLTLHTPPADAGSATAPSGRIRIEYSSAAPRIAPGQTVTLTVRPVDGFLLDSAVVATPFSSDTLTRYPFTVTLLVPYDYAGPMPVRAIGKDPMGSVVEDVASFEVRPRASLTEIKPAKTSLTLPQGSVTVIPVYGKYDDGFDRNVTGRARGTTYTSSNPSVVAADSEGVFRAGMPGSATITVSNSGVHSDIWVRVEPSATLAGGSRAAILPVN